MTQLEMTLPTAASPRTNVPEVVPGCRRVTSVWMQPTSSGRSTPTADPIPASAGRWAERSPGVFARVTVAIPVTVGSVLGIR